MSLGMEKSTNNLRISPIIFSSWSMRCKSFTRGKKRVHTAFVVLSGKGFGERGRMIPSMIYTPSAFAAELTSNTSFSLIVNSFSHSTCFPAAIAARHCSL